eukprot:TRINITY_DN145_c0_g1_i1.p1 TRINITY_DN145_c0_g1~~TRINITY_DN145_c0_g1_i1.p1  ORF type:complete len:218 (-),score=83.11 TRINITY_DN145_c0_g1_i1:214-867(-)
MCIRDRWYQRRVHGDINTKEETEIHQRERGAIANLKQMNSIRNFVFRAVSGWTRLKTEARFIRFAGGSNNQYLKEARDDQIKLEQLIRQKENYENMILNNLDEIDRQKLILLKHVSNLESQRTISRNAVRQRLDVLQLIKESQMYINHPEKFAPEVVEFETLKVKYLLQEPGAFDAFKQYVVARPYLTKFKHWVDYQERTGTFLPGLSEKTTAQQTD